MVGDPSGGGGGDGRLEETSCADLLRSLAKEGFSGVLELEGPRAVGRMWFREGRPYDGEYGRLTTYAALHALLRLRRGLYTFEPGPAREDVSPFEETLEDLLEEGLHRAKHADLLRSRLPGEDERLVVDLDHPHLYRMGIDVTGLAEVFMYGATIEDALVNSPLGEVETLQILLIMNRAGILSAGPTASTSTATTVSLDEPPLRGASRRETASEPSLGRGTPDATRSGASRFAALAATVLIAAGLGGALAWSGGAFDGSAPDGGAAMPVQGADPSSTKAAAISGAAEDDGAGPAGGETLPSDALAAGAADDGDTDGAQGDGDTESDTDGSAAEASTPAGPSAAGTSDASPAEAEPDEPAKADDPDAPDDTKGGGDDDARDGSPTEPVPPAEVASPSDDAVDDASEASSSTGGATTEPAAP